MLQYRAPIKTAWEPGNKTICNVGKSASVYSDLNLTIVLFNNKLE